MSILLEAHKLVHKDRQAVYGTPFECLTKTAEVFSKLTGRPFTAREVGIFNMVQKMVRDSFQPKRDNIVDIAGYAECIGLLDTEPVNRSIAKFVLSEYPEPPYQGHET